MKIKNDRIVIEQNSNIIGCTTCRKVSYNVNVIENLTGITKQQLQKIKNPHECIPELNHCNLWEILEYYQVPKHVIHKGFVVK